MNPHLENQNIISHIIQESDKKCPHLSKPALNNISSSYFLKYLFSHITEKTKLKLIKINKNIQNKINISVENYKKYNKEKTSIEIEITLEKSNSKYINVEKVDKKYYKNKYIDCNKIEIIVDYKVKSFKKLFSLCDIQSIKFKKFYRNNIIDMDSMFCGCAFLKEITFLNFNTENVKNMHCMFHGCSKLKELDLSKFNTKNVKNMSGMFCLCSDLKKIEISNFETLNVTNMSAMFANCAMLEKIDISKFNTINVSDMNGMFAGCLALKNINISNFNIHNLIDISNMFFNCKSLEQIDLFNFNTNKIINIDNMFAACSDKLKTKIKKQNPNINKKIFEEPNDDILDFY